VILEFRRYWRGYNAGESAYFDPAPAQRLIYAGIAVPAEGERRAELGETRPAPGGETASPAPAPTTYADLLARATELARSREESLSDIGRSTEALTAYIEEHG
jgi:hypothetical protein